MTQTRFHVQQISLGSARRALRYYDTIKKSAIREDYELNDAVIRKIDRVLCKWQGIEAWLDQVKKERQTARSAIKRLQILLAELPELWHEAYFNGYLQELIYDAYFRQRRIVAEEERRVTVFKLAEMDKEFRHLRDAVNEAASQPAFVTPIRPTIETGRDNEEQRNRAICALGQIWSKCLDPCGSRSDFVHGILKSVSVNITKKTVQNVLARRSRNLPQS